MQIDRIEVISLDRTPERFERFTSVNSHVPVVRFPAVDGRAMDRRTSIEHGLISSDNAYTRGALGSAASHVALWRSCVTQDQPLHIAEDDAILRGDFLEIASAALGGLPSWDYVLWGWNFDWPMKVRLAPGLGSSILESNQDELRREWQQFSRFAGDAPALARLVSCAGTCCYSLSPAGASRLLDLVIPIGNQPAPYPLQPKVDVVNTSLDLEMSRHFELLEAYVAIPCLAISLNQHAESTIYGS